MRASRRAARAGSADALPASQVQASDAGEADRGDETPDASLKPARAQEHVMSGLLEGSRHASPRVRHCSGHARASKGESAGARWATGLPLSLWARVGFPRPAGPSPQPQPAARSLSLPRAHTVPASPPSMPSTPPPPQWSVISHSDPVIQCFHSAFRAHRGHVRFSHPRCQTPVATSQTPDTTHARHCH